MAVAYPDSVDFQREYGPHVDNCRYCSDLVDALHPPEKTLAGLIGTMRDAATEIPDADPAVPFNEAWSAVAAMTQALATREGPADGSLQILTTVHRRLAETHALLNGAHSVAPLAWSGTVAISMDAQVSPGPRPAFDDAFAATLEQVASHLLSFGFRIAHVDDLQANGPSERLFNLARQFGRRSPVDPPPYAHAHDNAGYGVDGYCAWPAPIEQFAANAKQFPRFHDLHYLTLDGEPHPYTEFRNDIAHMPDSQTCIEGMAVLRDTIRLRSLARLAIGGAPARPELPMPTVAEDALASLQHGQPLYVLGGFGGCARDIATALRLTDNPTTGSALRALEPLAAFAEPQSLHNGLDAAENRSLADTADVEEAMCLVLRGLSRVAAHGTRAA